MEKKRIIPLSDIILLISYICGVIGMVYTISFSPFLNFKKPVVYIITVVACIIIWLLYDRKKLNIIGIIFAILLLLFNIKFLNNQWHNIYDIVFYDINKLNNYDITETVLIVSLIVSFIIYWVTFRIGKGWIFYIVSIAVIIVGPIIGNPPNIIQVCLFVFFHLGISITGNMISIKKKKDRIKQKLLNTAGLSVFFTGIFFIVSLIAAYKIADNRMEELFSIPITLESKFQELSTTWNFTSVDQGRISRGNNNAIGREKLEITVSEKPNKIIYLKNFIGADYLDNRWEEEEGRFYPGGIIRDKEDNEDDETNNLYYDDRKFTLVFNTEREKRVEGEVAPLAKWLKVKNLTGGEEYNIPYISKYQSRQGDEYAFTIYKEEDFLKAIKDIDSDAYMLYKDIEDEYESYAEDNYLNVSKERFPNLSKLIEENPLNDTTKITNFIKNTMWSMASYTLSPGTIPIDKEIPEYFLFESGKGYCVHFATTATLMYRMYGIPARYVTGYIANQSQFEEYSKNIYKAVITDRKAHAWVEIYIEGFGWQKVEVTPSIEEISEEIEEVQNNIIEEENEEVSENSEIEEQEESIEEELGTEKEEDSHINRESFSNIITLLIIITLALGVIASICYIILLRRNKILQRYNKLYSDILLTKIIEVLHFGGYIKDFTGMEPEFIYEISKIVPNITVEIAEEIMNSALQETFGNSHASSEKTNKVLFVYENACIFVYEGLSIWKKLYFRYIKVYW